MATDKKEKKKKKKPPKSRLRRIIRATLITLSIILLLLLIFAPVTLNAGWFNGYIASKIGASLGGRAEIDGVEFGYFSGVTVKGLRLAHPENSRGIIDAGSIEIGYGNLCSFLWSGTIKKIRAEKVALELVIGPDNKLDWQIPKSEGESQYIIDLVEVADSSVTVKNNGDVFKFVGINTTLRDLTRGKTSQFEFTARLEEKDTLLHITGAAEIISDNPKGDIKVETALLPIKALARPFHARLSPFIEFKTGTMQSRMSIHFENDRVAFTGLKTTVPNLAFTLKNEYGAVPIDETNLVLNIDATYEIKTGILHIGSLTIKTDNLGTISGSCLVNTKTFNVENANLKIHKAPIANVLALLPQDRTENGNPYDGSGSVSLTMQYPVGREKSIRSSIITENVKIFDRKKNMGVERANGRIVSLINPGKKESTSIINIAMKDFKLFLAGWIIDTHNSPTTIDLTGSFRSTQKNTASGPVTVTDIKIGKLEPDKDKIARPGGNMRHADLGEAKIALEVHSAPEKSLFRLALAIPNSPLDGLDRMVLSHNLPTGDDRVMSGRGTAGLALRYEDKLELDIKLNFRDGAIRHPRSKIFDAEKINGVAGVSVSADDSNETAILFSGDFASLTLRTGGIKFDFAEKGLGLDIPSTLDSKLNRLSLSNKSTITIPDLGKISLKGHIDEFNRENIFALNISAKQLPLSQLAMRLDTGLKNIKTDGSASFAIDINGPPATIDLKGELGLTANVIDTGIINLQDTKLRLPITLHEDVLRVTPSFSAALCGIKLKAGSAAPEWFLANTALLTDNLSYNIKTGVIEADAKIKIEKSEFSPDGAFYCRVGVREKSPPAVEGEFKLKGNANDLITGDFITRLGTIEIENGKALAIKSGTENAGAERPFFGLSAVNIDMKKKILTGKIRLSLGELETKINNKKSRQPGGSYNANLSFDFGKTALTVSDSLLDLAGAAKLSVPKIHAYRNGDSFETNAFTYRLSADLKKSFALSEALSTKLPEINIDGTLAITGGSDALVLDDLKRKAATATANFEVAIKNVGLSDEDKTFSQKGFFVSGKLNFDVRKNTLASSAWKITGGRDKNEFLRINITPGKLALNTMTMEETVFDSNLDIARGWEKALDLSRLKPELKGYKPGGIISVKNGKLGRINFRNMDSDWTSASCEIELYKGIIQKNGKAEWEHLTAKINLNGMIGESFSKIKTQDSSFELLDIAKFALAAEIDLAEKIAKNVSLKLPPTEIGPVWDKIKAEIPDLLKSENEENDLTKWDFTGTVGFTLGAKTFSFGKKPNLFIFGNLIVKDGTFNNNNFEPANTRIGEKVNVNINLKELSSADSMKSYRLALDGDMQDMFAMLGFITVSLKDRSLRFDTEANVDSVGNTIRNFAFNVQSKNIGGISARGDIENLSGDAKFKLDVMLDKLKLAQFYDAFVREDMWAFYPSLYRGIVDGEMSAMVKLTGRIPKKGNLEFDAIGQFDLKDASIVMSPVIKGPESLMNFLLDLAARKDTLINPAIAAQIKRELAEKKTLRERREYFNKTMKDFKFSTEQIDKIFEDFEASDAPEGVSATDASAGATMIRRIAKMFDMSFEDVSPLAVVGVSWKIPINLHYPDLASFPKPGEIPENAFAPLSIKRIKSGPLMFGDLKPRAAIFKNSIVMKDILTLNDFFGGEVKLDGFRLDNFLSSKWRVFSKGVSLKGLSFKQLTSGYGLTEFYGSANGVLEDLLVTENNLSSKGTIHMDVFDGKVDIRNFTATEFFSRYYTYNMDILITEPLSMFLLTETYKDVGRASGGLMGHLLNFKIEAGEESAFDLELYAVPKKGEEPKISTVLLSKLSKEGMILEKLGFNLYSYKELGIHAKLENDTITLQGRYHRKGGDWLMLGKGTKNLKVGILKASTGYRNFKATLLENISGKAPEAGTSKKDDKEDDNEGKKKDKEGEPEQPEVIPMPQP